MIEQFRDRRDAGRRLAAALDAYRGRPGIVLGIPRGGVVVAAEVARALDWPLDVVVARKVGAPWRPELAIGAVAEGRIVRINADWVRRLGIDERHVHDEVARQQVEMHRRIERYRGGAALPKLHGRVAIVVDDGVATGDTACAALAAVRALGPAELVFAAPIASREAVRELERLTDRVVCPIVDLVAGAVGAAYEDFAQTSDEEVLALLQGISHRVPTPPEGDEAVALRAIGER